MKRTFFYGFIIAGVLGILFFAPSSAHAAITNISAGSSAHWAWNDEIGWIDFYDTNSVKVSAAQLTGYASSSVGAVSLDCATSPAGNVCGTSNYKVTNDGSGDLSGWAWNDEIGWISFYWGDTSSTYPTATTTTLCQSYGSYCGVSISGGVFQGWAWNDTVGWIDFNCDNGGGICGTSNFNVTTSWVPQAATGTVDSETFDTGVASGAELNSVTWKGSLPAGTSVGFQFAVSNSSSGPWNYFGPGGNSATTYSGIFNTPISLDYSLNGRYFRYRTILTTNTAQTATPRVDDVIVNWSP